METKGKENNKTKRIKIRIIMLIFSILVVLPSIVVSPSDGDGISDADYIISFKSRQFVPPEGIPVETLENLASLGVPRPHALLQTYEIPDERQKNELRELGVEFLDHVPNFAFFMSLPLERAVDIANLPSVRAITHILPEDKIPERILRDGVNDFSRNPDGTIRLIVLFYDDVDLDEGSAVISSHKGTVNETLDNFNTLMVDIPEVELAGLLGEDIVQWVEDEFEPTVFNDGNRKATGVEIVQAPPFNLDGTGVVIGEWDGGHAIDTSNNIRHQDLAGRVIRGDATTAWYNSHATHVAGTAIGDGSLSASKGGTSLQWRGMAPNATLISYDWYSFLNEHSPAISNYGIDLSTNSWGGWVGGVYSWYSQQIDEIVRGSAGKRISHVWAAGNSGPGFGTVVSYGQTSKNSITVGATISNDDSLAGFSSRGPTNDGRIKPDVVAPGCESGDLVTIPASPSLDTQNEITMEVWIKPEGSRRQAILEYNDGSIFGVHLWQFGTFDTLYVNFRDTANGNHQIYSPAGQFAAGNWHHVVATYDGSVGKLYINGTEVASKPLGSFTLQTSYDLYVGARISHRVYRYNGIIDEVAIYSNAFTAQEVQDRFNNIPIPSSPVLDMHMDEGVGQIVNDSTIFKNDGFLGSTPGSDTNDPEWKSGVECISGSCLAFVGGDGGVRSTRPIDKYGPGCGTSMAAPTVAGSIALLLQQWRKLFTVDPWPSTIKAILIHTAKDLNNTGPDYYSGYGRINVTTAAELIIDDGGTNDLIKEYALSQGDMNDFFFSVPAGTNSFKVTLAWDDFPGTPNAITSLVNNLDLVLVDPNNVVYRPYVLDSLNPANPATTGVDNINNVEQVEVVSPIHGIWKAVINGILIPKGPQDYSLILPFVALPPPDSDGDGVPDTEDNCPDIPGMTERQGCLVGDENLVELHVIDRARIFCDGASSCKLPIEGALVKIFDRNDAGFQALWTKNPPSVDYSDVFEADVGRVASCVTDGDGRCVTGEESIGDYLVIVKYVDEETGKTVYTGKPKSPEDFRDTDSDGIGDLAFKDFQVIKVINKDETVELKAGSKTVIIGSILEIIHPQYTIWESNRTLYPFIFTSDSDWTVDVCLYVPEGYKVAEGECTQVFVTNETKVILFTAIELNSPEPNIKVNIKTKHKGILHMLNLDIPGLRRAKGLEKAKEKSRGIPFLAIAGTLVITINILQSSLLLQPLTVRLWMIAKPFFALRPIRSRVMNRLTRLRKSRKNKPPRGKKIGLIAARSAVRTHYDL